MDITNWEKLNPPRRGSVDETNQAWERELEDDKCMRDAPPPPPRSRTNSLSTHSSDGDAPPREAVELCGICMLIEHMMANPPPGAAEPQQLSAFWATTDAMAGAVPTVPSPNVAELHDFLFRLFATTGHTPECSVLSFMYILRLFSYHAHLRITPRNCKRLLLCSVMVAQKNHDDAPLRNVDFATAWGHVLPGERPVSPERINAMEHVLLNGLGFDLYVPQDQYEACVAELRGLVRSHGAGVQDLAVLLQRHAEFLTTQAAHLPWTTPPQRVSLSTRRRRFQ